MQRKALFFDIDGTLFSERDREVPDSAVSALRKARKNGHLIFINTGRTYCQTRDIRDAVQADGYLCGCGTYILSEGEVRYNHVIPRERGLQIRRDILRYGLDGVLEGVECCYIREGVSRIPELERIKGLLRQQAICSTLSWEDPAGDFSKFCVMADEGSRPGPFFESLREFDVIDRGRQFYECVPKGHSKATAIELILKQYHIQKADAWVFGDSMNDLAMFQYADNAVLMEKHDKGLEPYATFTTRAVEEDGIAYALSELGMVG